jgi:hypothetical protein
LRTDVTIRIVEGGFPHSEIYGSKLIRSSPWLIAAYHVLHRLSAPRHPPNALKALDRSHDRCPHTRQSLLHAALKPELETQNSTPAVKPCALHAAGYDLERPVCFVRSNRQRGGQASLKRNKDAEALQAKRSHSIPGDYDCGIRNCLQIRTSERSPLYDVINPQSISPTSEVIPRTNQRYIGAHCLNTLNNQQNLKFLVEADGIEPTTSCLQSTRSPRWSPFRDRTDDLKLAKLPLSQLMSTSAAALKAKRANMVGLGGFEPPTSRLSSARSNQLSYRPKAKQLCGAAKDLKRWPRIRGDNDQASIQRIRPEKKEKRRRRSPACRGLIWPLCSKGIKGIDHPKTS